MPAPPTTKPSAAVIPSQTIAAPDERFEYELRNLGEVPIGFGDAYRLERRADSHWQRCPLPYGFRTWGAVLMPGGARRLTAWVPTGAEPGHYRLVKEIRAAPREHLPPASDDARIEVDFEFDVVAPA